jgi:hypothetical protein
VHKISFFFVIHQGFELTGLHFICVADCYARLVPKTNKVYQQFVADQTREGFNAGLLSHSGLVATAAVSDSRARV